MSFHGGTSSDGGPRAVVMFHDPFASAALSPKEHANGALGSFANLGFTTAEGATAGATVGTAILPGVGTAIGSAIGTIAGLFQSGIDISHLFGGGTPDEAKAVWSKIPGAYTRLEGGHGRWTDSLTGESMEDAGTDVRKGAIMASAVGMYNDQRNWWFDAATGQHVDPGTAAGRWKAIFGAGTPFEAAYAQAPERFAIFSSVDSSTDPYIPSQGGTPMQHAATALPGNPYVPPVAISSSPASPGGIVTGFQPAIAGVLGAISPTTLMIAAVALVGVFLLSGKKARR